MQPCYSKSSFWKYRSFLSWVIRNPLGPLKRAGPSNLEASLRPKASTALSEKRTTCLNKAVIAYPQLSCRAERNISIWTMQLTSFSQLCANSANRDESDDLARALATRQDSGRGSNPQPPAQRDTALALAKSHTRGGTSMKSQRPYIRTGRPASPTYCFRRLWRSCFGTKVPV